MSRSPAISICCTGSARFSRRSRLLAALRERPTACAACSCVRPNSSTRRFRPCASSSGFRSSRWMFSISAITAAASSATALTSTGTCVQPGQLGGAEAALAGDDLVAPAVQRPHQDRLHHALAADALGEFVQRALVHARARLVACRAAGGRAASVVGCAGGRRCVADLGAEQGLQAETQALGFLGCHRRIVRQAASPASRARPSGQSLRPD